MSSLEEQALLVYLRKEIKLRQQPYLLKAAFSVLHLVIIEDFHRTHVDYTLTADVSAGVKLGKPPAHAGKGREASVVRRLPHTNSGILLAAACSALGWHHYDPDRDDGAG
ncbi:hypothetical protein PC120_g26617 [Phytophthora cactorum]|nr:hypothetical protein PC120_g26617 [Phytophthora cactorum]